jgi:hypothetical protein
LSQAKEARPARLYRFVLPNLRRGRIPHGREIPPPNCGIQRSQPQQRESVEVGEEDKLGTGEATADERR